MGYTIQQLSTNKGISFVELCDTLNCTESQLKAFLQGRMIISFEQLCKLADLLDASISTLLHGDVEQYNKYMINCIGHFSDNNNRETILDLIDDYMDVLDAISI